MKECQLKDEITKLKSKLKPQILTDEDIAKVIESWTKIPVQKITEEEILVENAPATLKIINFRIKSS